MPPVVPDVAIVSYDTADYLLALLRSLAPLVADRVIADVHVWDNGSRDGTDALLARWSAAHAWLHPWRSPTNVHHGPALDALLRHACRAEWTLVLDADTEVCGSLARPLALCEQRDVAFVGQIHPQMPRLYAYLAHLLVHRPTYALMPPFRHHGAPGIDYFAAIAREQRPYARFRWVDVVQHAGQGALRRVAASGDRAHAFYAFARDEAAASPKSEDRRQHEARLGTDLAAFLAQPGPGDGLSRAKSASPVAVTIGERRARAWRGNLRVALHSPRRARTLARAQKLGLDLLADESAALAAALERHRPRGIVEIDTMYAGRLALCAGVAASGARLVSVGLPPWEMDDPGEPSARRQLANLGGARARVSVIRSPACDAATVRQVLAILDGLPIDLLVVSGRRSYAELAEALETYAGAVVAGGAIVIPDIHRHPRDWSGEGPRFWQDVRHRFRHETIVANPAQEGFGIGVLWN